LGEDVIRALRRAHDDEISSSGKEIIGQILENSTIARREGMALCQDCGVTVLFVEIGSSVNFIGGDLDQAIQNGVRKGYREGYLRNSVVMDPIFERRNTGDNTPAVIHYEIVSGDKVKIILMPKGGGSENMSRIRVLTPAQGINGLKEFVIETVERASGNACPPVIVGVGVGGTIEKSAVLAKKALVREINKPNPDERIADLETELLKRINSLGIGPMGLGGRTTALAVHIETFPSHIASLPVAVNLQCHSVDRDRS
jgi:fumarate hydratase subunit alpha